MLYPQLLDWQKKIINDFEDRDSFLVYLDMGLGKTVVFLAFAEAKESDKVIIITTAKKAEEDETIDGSFLFWASQMQIKYNLYNKKCNFRGEGSKKWQKTITPQTKDLLIVNYETLYDRKNNNELSTIMKDFINSCQGLKVTLICDESHKLKTLNSVRTNSVKKIQRELALRKNKVFTYLGTGTPFTAGYEDLYSQLKFVGWEENKTFFTDHFCIRGKVFGLMEWQQPIVGYKNIDQLYHVIHRFGITIKSDSVVKLPPQTFVYHKLPNTEDMTLMTCEKLKLELIEKYIKDKEIVLPYALNESKQGGKINNPFYRNINFPDPKWLAETAGVFWGRSRQLSVGFQGNSEEFKWFNKTRLQKLKELLEDEPDNYVLFYNYDPEFYEIFDICEELGYKVDVCNGSIKSEYFYQKYLKQSEGERLVNTKNIILANFGSGAEGGNWQAFSKCILFSLPVFKDWQQGLKRVHRMGQKETVIYHVFYSDNWLDQSMLQALKESKQYDLLMFESDLKRVQDLLSPNE